MLETLAQSAACPGDRVVTLPPLPASVCCGPCGVDGHAGASLVGDRQRDVVRLRNGYRLAYMPVRNAQVILLTVVKDKPESSPARVRMNVQGPCSGGRDVRRWRVQSRARRRSLR